MHILHPSKEHQPYRKKARWEKELDKQLWIISSKTSFIAQEAYLYLPARRKKQESFKKGRQKGSNGSQYWRVKKMRIIFGVICARTAAGSGSNQGE
jgi:hypothetical protein